MTMGGGESLLDVVDDILRILQADAETHQIRGDAGSPKLLVGQLTMGVGSGMKDA